jgi:hypothetical protein
LEKPLSEGYRNPVYRVGLHCKSAIPGSNPGGAFLILTIQFPGIHRQFLLFSKVSPDGVMGLCSRDWGGFVLAPPSPELDRAMEAYTFLQRRIGRVDWRVFGHSVGAST